MWVGQSLHVQLENIGWQPKIFSSSFNNNPVKMVALGINRIHAASGWCWFVPADCSVEAKCNISFEGMVPALRICLVDTSLFLPTKLKLMKTRRKKVSCSMALVYKPNMEMVFVVPRTQSVSTQTSQLFLSQSNQHVLTIDCCCPDYASKSLDLNYFFLCVSGWCGQRWIWLWSELLDRGWCWWWWLHGC